MKRKPIPKKVSAKPEMDINSINTMLKNSFSAIKLDMIHLKEVQEAQLRDTGSLKNELKSFKQTCATKDDVKKLKDKMSSLETRQSVQSEKIKELENYSDDIISAVNGRIKELNDEFKKILQVKADLNSKMAKFAELEKSLKEIKKSSIDKKQLKKVVEDINTSFDDMEAELASKKELLKLAKRVDKLKK